MIRIVCNSAQEENLLKAKTLCRMIEDRGCKAKVYSSLDMATFTVNKGDITCNLGLDIKSSLGVFFLNKYHSIPQGKTFRSIVLMLIQLVFFNKTCEFLKNKPKIFSLLNLCKKIYFCIFNPILEKICEKIYHIELINIFEYDIPILYDNADLNRSTEVAKGDKVAIFCDVTQDCHTAELVEKVTQSHKDVILYGAVLNGAYFYDKIEPYMKSGKIKFAGRELDRAKIYNQASIIYTSNSFAISEIIVTECKNFNIPCEVLSFQAKANKMSINTLITKLCKI